MKTDLQDLTKIVRMMIELMATSSYMTSKQRQKAYEKLTDQLRQFEQKLSKGD